MSSHEIQLIPAIIYGPTSLRQSFTEVVYTLMNSSMEMSIQQVQLMKFKIEAMYSEVNDQIMRSQQNSNEIFDKMLSDYKELFLSHNELPCVQENMDEMRNISSYGRNNALKCVDLATKQMSQIQDKVSEYYESITSSIKNINEVNQQCNSSTNPMWIGICVVDNVRLLTSINE